MTRPLPDFIIGGGPRSGTTWMYHLLDRHPDIYMAKPIMPEPKFFLVDDLYTRGMDYYLDTWFKDIGSAKMAGEKTTNYLESINAAERIHKHLPQVKLVFVLREPTERAWSNYLWSRMNGLETEDFGTALALEDEREKTVAPKLRFARPHAYYSRGLYADLLAPYFNLFPRAQICVLRYDDIINSPRELTARLHNFLAVAPRPQDSDGLGVINASEKANMVVPDEVKAILKDRYIEPNERLAKLLGPEFQVWTQ